MAAKLQFSIVHRKKFNFVWIFLIFLRIFFSIVDQSELAHNSAHLTVPELKFFFRRIDVFSMN